MQVSFYDIVFWEKQHTFLTQMAKIKMKVIRHTTNTTQVKNLKNQLLSPLTSLLMPSLLNQPNTTFFFLRLGTKSPKWLNPLILALYLPVIFTTYTFMPFKSHLGVIPLCSPHMIFNILPIFLA